MYWHIVLWSPGQNNIKTPTIFYLSLQVLQEQCAKWLNKVAVKIKSPQFKTFHFAVSCDKIEIQHGIVTTHATGPYFPGDHINILCDDGYELQLKGQIYEISQIFCDKYGKWNVDDI